MSFLTFNSRPFSQRPRRPIAFPLFITLTALIIWLLLRIVLWIDVGPAQLSAVQTLSAFGLGVWFDLWTMAYLICPWLLIFALTPRRWNDAHIVHVIRWVAAWFIIASLLFGAVSEFVFWQEFTTRFNFIAVDYLIYTSEVIGNIRESYPVPWILAGIGLLSGALIWFFYRRVTFTVAAPSPRFRALLLLAVFILPLLSYKLANLDQQQATGNAYADELAGNGLYGLAAAMRRNELDYDKFYKTIPQSSADQILAGLGVRRLPLAQTTDLPLPVSEPGSNLGPFTRRPKNVVLITVESLSAEYMGAYGSKKNLTPNLDKLTSAGLKFERLFATGTRTVRGLDATTLGIPPIPGQAIVHRPHNEHLTTIGELLKAQGYSTLWLYGGYGYFDNMNAYYRGNDYRVIDRTDFDKKTIAGENVWGVADESLFDNTLTTLDETAKSNKPFFAQIMTTSNHRPYTFPAGRIDIASGSRDGAVKYTDYAIGRFIAQAKTKPWFADTLFVIVADHCSSVAGKTKLPVAKYHIPLIFYAPDMLKPASYNPVASQIDIPPTLLDILGVKGENNFFGHSMLNAEPQATRAFISNYQELGYYKNDTLIVLSPKKKTQAFKIDPSSYEAEKSAMNTILLQEAIAYYQTAASAFKQGKMGMNAASMAKPQ